MVLITKTDLQVNPEKYVSMAQTEDVIIIEIENGKAIAKPVSADGTP